MNGSYTITEPMMDRSAYFTSNYNNHQQPTTTSASMIAQNPRQSSTISNSSGNSSNRLDLSKPMGHSHSKSGDLTKSPSSKNLSHVPCKFFRQGACQAGGSCPFSHATDLTSDSQPCKYFQKGNCKFGVRCALAHILPDGRRVNPKSLQQAYQQHQHQHQHQTQSQPQSQQQNGNYSLVGNSRSSRHSFSGTEPVTINSYKSPFGSYASLSSSYDNNNNNNNSFSTTPTNVQARLFMSATNNNQSSGIPISINTNIVNNTQSNINSTSPYGGNSIWSSTPTNKSSPNGSFYEQLQSQSQHQDTQSQPQAQQYRFLRSLSGSSYQRLSFSNPNPNISSNSNTSSATASTPVNYINSFTKNGSITPTRPSSFGGNGSTASTYYNFSNGMNSLSLNGTVPSTATTKNDNAIVDSDDDLNDHSSTSDSQKGSFNSSVMTVSDLVNGLSSSATQFGSSYKIFQNGYPSNQQQQTASSSVLGSYTTNKLVMSQENEEAIIEEEEPTEEIDFLPDSLNDLLTPQELKRRLSRPSFNSGIGGRPSFTSPSGEVEDTQFVME